MNLSKCQKYRMK